MPNNDVLKRFDFGINITKAWQDPDSGRHFIKGIASDTGVDHHGERFSEKALDGMVSCIQKSYPADVILLPTHWDTFEIGKAVTANVVTSPTHADLKALDVTIELDMEYPQAKALYKEIESGKAQKQMSVGGYLNPESDEAYFWEEKTYETEDGNVLNDYLLVLNDLVLDHIAVTRKDHAANPRTGFSEAIAKSLGLEKPQRPQLTINKEVEKMSKNEKQTQTLIEMVSKSIASFFKSDDESLKVVADAKQKAQEALDALQAVEGTEELQAQFKSILEDQVEKSEEPVVEEPVVEEPVVEEAEKSVDEAPVVDEAVETPALDVEALKSSIVEDITKSISDEQQETFKEISKSLGEVIAQTIKSAIEPLQNKITELEKFSGKSKSLDGQESDAPVVKSVVKEDEDNMWSGIIKSALPSHILVERQMDNEGGNE
jgi:hypothetical protein